jgi:TetR/AcrR family transcriptional regulator, cholesterol catabolism regulator
MTREDILEAAAQVFRQKGFHGASMSDIAAAVSLRKASLYHHVSSKQEILLELLERALELLLERISLITTQNISADEKLQRMIREYLQILVENIDLASVLLFEHRSLERRQRTRHIPNRDKFESLWKDVIIEGTRHIPNRDKFESLWKDVIIEGVDKKIFTCENPSVATRALLGIMNWTITWYRPDGDLSIEQIADQYSDLLLKGLLK